MRNNKLKFNDMAEREAVNGLFTGAAATALWNSQQNPPQIEINGRRVHHGEVGMILLGLGILEFLTSKKKEDKSTGASAIGFGSALMIDDWNDREEWFTRDSILF